MRKYKVKMSRKQFESLIPGLWTSHGLYRSNGSYKTYLKKFTGGQTFKVLSYKAGIVKGKSWLEIARELELI